MQEITAKEMEDVVEDGDILFFRGTSLVSLAIMSITGGACSHVGIICDIGNIKFLCEADSNFSTMQGMVRAIPLVTHVKDLMKEGKIFIGRMRDRKNIGVVTNAVVELTGSTYDFTDIKNIAFNCIPFVQKKKHKDDSEYFCSELVDDCFSKIGVRLS